MADRMHFETLAAEADRSAETALSFPMAQGWRDIAQGYRRLAEFMAAAEYGREEVATLAPSRGWVMGRRHRPGPP